jgi:hypothetical protein
MTKFEELMDITKRKTRSQNKNESIGNEPDQEELEVAGSESSKTPLLLCGDEDIDGSIVDDLYRKGQAQTTGRAICRKLGLTCHGLWTESYD